CNIDVIEFMAAKIFKLSYERDGNTNAAGALEHKSLATEQWLRLTEDKQNKSEIKTYQAAEDAKETMKRYVAILSEQVLKKNNMNLFFSSINDSDELLQLRNENYFHSIHHASTSLAARKSVSLDLIKRAAGWSGDSLMFAGCFTTAKLSIRKRSAILFYYLNRI
ncbi:hypothetical protein ALC62_01096, partial [Cyphomyrmex costatus]